MPAPHAPLNRVPSGCSAVVESITIPLGPAPWNLYPACPIDTNGHIEIECFNSLKPDGTIPLGFCYCSKKVSKKLHQRSVSGAFLRLFNVP